MRDRDMRIELTQAAKNLLAERGFDPVLGARPLRRTIQREIEDVLAEKMLYGEVGPGQIVLVDVEGEGPTATFTFQGQKVGELPDLPPFETAEVGGAGRARSDGDRRAQGRPEGQGRRGRRPARPARAELSDRRTASRHAAWPGSRGRPTGGPRRSLPCTHADHGQHGQGHPAQRAAVRRRQPGRRRRPHGGVRRRAGRDGPGRGAEWLEEQPHVTRVRTGEEWWAGDRPGQLNVRQRINANLLKHVLARVDWAEWLFHIDGDEIVQVDRAVLDTRPGRTRPRSGWPRWRR